MLIQTSLPGRYWAEGLHTAVYLLNRLPTKTISAACPHVALFDSAPSYEHIHVFSCACYPNITATASHKFTPRSTRCVFLGYFVDHKGYRCLDLLTNRLIVSQHVVFDEDNFPLAASPSLTDLAVWSHGFHHSDPLITEGTSTPAPHRPAPEIPLGFEPPVAPLPAPVVPPGFLPWAATLAAPPAVTDSPAPRTWPASPIAYVWREVRARAAGTRCVPGAALRREAGAGAQTTRDALGTALCWEVGAGAAGTRGTPGAALRQEAGAGAQTTCGVPGAPLSQELGARAAGTRGAPGAPLSQEVGVRAAGTRGIPGAPLSREVGAGAAGTRGAPELS
jgi:hypothetical protein